MYILQKVKVAMSMAAPVNQICVEFLWIFQRTYIFAFHLDQSLEVGVQSANGCWNNTTLGRKCYWYFHLPTCEF